MNTYRCIWCTAEKPETEFNVEHVMPQSFGTFKASLTLVNDVCKACNDYFANNLEPSLARDSLEGFDRFRYGLKPPSEFSSLGKRSTSRVQIAEGPYAGAWAFTVKGDSTSIMSFPQIGFSKSADGPFEWHMLDAVPTLDELKAKGYGPEPAHLRLCGCSQEEVAELLAAKGFNPTYTGTTHAPPAGWVDHVFRPGLVHRRALAKIALNYVAKQLGLEVALESRFDRVRELVLRGREPVESYYTIDGEPVLNGDKRDGVRLFGHFLVLEVINGSLVATVSLYNRFRHRVTLAAHGSSLYQGHYFDIATRQIFSILEVADLLEQIALRDLPHAAVATQPKPEVTSKPPTCELRRLVRSGEC
jgi:hypothetical protein